VSSPRNSTRETCTARRGLCSDMSCGMPSRTPAPSASLTNARRVVCAVVANAQASTGDPCRGRAALLAVCTSSDDTASRLRAGEALGALLLHGSAGGMAMVPLSQAIEWTKYAAGSKKSCCVTSCAHRLWSRSAGLRRAEGQFRRRADGRRTARLARELLQEVVDLDEWPRRDRHSFG
jgi:hypothetical protein